MLSNILQGMVFGFILTAIPGAVFLEATRRALAKMSVLSFLGGNFVGVGITVAVTISGLSSILRNSSWSHVFYLLSGATLLYIGLASLASRKFIKPASASDRKDHQATSHSRAFITGVILSIANPINILFWVTMIGRYLNNHESYVQVILNSIAILLGGAVFYGALLTAIHMTHRLIPQRYMIMLTDVFGVIILIYGGFIMSKAL